MSEDLSAFEVRPRSLLLPWLVEVLYSETNDVQAKISALENRVHQLQSHIQAEREALPKVITACTTACPAAAPPPTLWCAQVRAVLQAVQLQQAHLEHVAASLPAHLPAAAAAPAAQPATEQATSAVASAATGAQAKKVAAAPAPPEKPLRQVIVCIRPPRLAQGHPLMSAGNCRLVTKSEFEGLSSFTTSRLTLDKARPARGIAELLCHSLYCAASAAELGP